MISANCPGASLTKSAGSLSEMLKIEMAKPAPLAKSMPRLVAFSPASSISKAKIRLLVNLFKMFRCSAVKAVPEVAMMFFTPSCQGRMASN